MTRIATIAILVLQLIALFSTSAFAATRTAASCNAGDVQAAMNSAAAGDTVAIPAGTCTWTAPVSWTAPANVVLQGAGSQTTTGGGDQTIIVDGYASSNSLLIINSGATASTVRMTGITFQGGSGGVKYDGIVQFQGSSQNIRVDHTHFNSKTYSPAQTSSLLEFQGCTSGVVDHSIFDNPAGSVNNAVRAYNGGSCYGDSLGVGDQSWAHSTSLGSSNFLFVENNTFNSGAGNDCTKGGRYVWRYNTMNMTSPPPAVQTHPTGGGQRERGCRAWEIYKNTFNAVSGNYINAAFWLSSGTGVVWGNTIPSSSAGGGTGFRSLISGHEMRYDSSTYPQTAPPNGWGYCGTHQTGTASAWDQNKDSTGYMCIDQPGAGIGQLLVNDFPKVINNSTGTIASPNQASEPVYEWADTYSPVPNNPSGIWSENESGLVVNNRDYYLGTANSGTPIAFNGTSGVGAGTLSARPSTCTPKVAYWATDTNTLYQCSAPNAWTAYYTPYTYPHPLTQGAAPPPVGDPPPTGAPAPATNPQGTWH